MSKIREYAPNQYSEVDKYIDQSNKLSLSRSKMMLKVREGDVVCPYQGLIPRYSGIFRDRIIERTLSDSEFHRYMFNPMLLCMDVYGTPELWSDILYINNMVSVTEFKKKKIKLFKTSIVDCCSELLMLCDTDLKRNNEEVSDD